MLRVPGSNQDLFSVRASGGDVRVVYSPIEALRIAKENPDRQVVFFGIGFETTAPSNAISVIKAKAEKITNYSMLVSHVCVPPAMRAILGSPSNRVQGFLAAGHVCAVMGYTEYEPIALQYRTPMAVTGFEPLDLALGIFETVKMLESGTYEVHNAYPRAVTREGNKAAQNIIHETLEPCDRNWRGIGEIPMSGWKLKKEYADFDAELRFDVADIKTKESEICISGLILQGLKKPFECPAFGNLCTPQNPLGATMVSSAFKLFFKIVKRFKYAIRFFLTFKINLIKRIKFFKFDWIFQSICSLNNSSSSQLILIKEGPTSKVNPSILS